MKENCEDTHGLGNAFLPAYKAVILRASKPPHFNIHSPTQEFLETPQILPTPPPLPAAARLRQGSPHALGGDPPLVLCPLISQPARLFVSRPTPSAESTKAQSAMKLASKALFAEVHTAASRQTYHFLVPSGLSGKKEPAPPNIPAPRRLQISAITLHNRRRAAIIWAKSPQDVTEDDRNRKQ